MPTMVIVDDQEEEIPVEIRVDKGEDLDENDSGVEDVSDMDSDVEECQIESLIKKYS